MFRKKGTLHTDLPEELISVPGIPDGHLVGMIPHGQADIDPSLNAIQSLVAVTRRNQWKVALFHNTPAAFHGRPESVAQLTEELRQLVKQGD